MNITIQPGRAVGTVAVPPSKSMAHRLLICAGLSQGVSRIRGLAYNEDILATIDCLRALGADCAVEGDTVTVTGVDMTKATPKATLGCRESGSTLRFFIPLALLCGKPMAFSGTEKLLSRPLSVYEGLCSRFCREGGLLCLQGSLAGGEYALPGDISSQFITGLLFALPLADRPSRIRITTAVESKSYIDLTLQAMALFGVKAWWESDRTLYIPGGQRYCAGEHRVEGDYSAAAFFAAMNVLGAQIRLEGLSASSLQGDKVCLQHLQSLCAGKAEIDLSDCPDLGPVLFAVAAAKEGAVFCGTRRLRLKESDRVAAMVEELEAFGAGAQVEENSVTLFPGKFHAPTRPLRGHNDHRIVMALSVLLTVTGGEIHGAEAVKKSFPDFFEKLGALGVEVKAYEAE